ncbi:MAG: OmpH family outer membrane protein [Ignavibacteria bacterium]
MKVLNVKTLVILLGLIFCISSFSYSQIKIGYVDRDGIIKQMPEYKKVEDEYQAFAKLFADTLQTKESELKTKAETFKIRYEEAQKLVESGLVKSDAELKKLSDEISDLQKELQVLDDALTVYKQKAQNELIQRQSELLKPLIEKMSKTVETVAKELKINFVFNKTDDLIYGEKESDITFKVLDKLK